MFWNYNSKWAICVSSPVGVDGSWWAPAVVRSDQLWNSGPSRLATQAKHSLSRIINTCSLLVLKSRFCLNVISFMIAHDVRYYRVVTTSTYISKAFKFFDIFECRSKYRYLMQEAFFQPHNARSAKSARLNPIGLHFVRNVVIYLYCIFQTVSTNI